MTKYNPTRNSQSGETPVSEGNKKSVTEEVDSSPGSSPSPPESPHSPTEGTPSLAELPELPEIITLCQRLTPSIDDLNKKRLTAPEFMTILVRELTPLIRKHLAPKKTAKKKRDIKVHTVRRCSICKTESTPEWRRDPEGLLTLCNACGLKEKKRARSTTTTSAGSNNAQRFHNTIWTQQYTTPNPQSSTTTSLPSQGPPRQPEPHRSSLALPASLPAAPVAAPKNSSHGPVYHSFQLKAPQIFRNEENRSNEVYPSQRYLNGSQLPSPPNLPPYAQSYYPVYEYEDYDAYGQSFGYHPQSDPHQNCHCPHCRPYYNPNQY